MAHDLSSFHDLSIYSFHSVVSRSFIVNLISLMDDGRLITCSISMDRWKSASPCPGICKVVIGTLNKKAMDLEFINLPVKPLLLSSFRCLIYLYSLRCSG